MSGLLSSLLIDPVVRQTRRFSNAQNNHQESLDRVQYETSPFSTPENDGEERKMSSQSQEDTESLSNRYAGPGNDPASSTMPMLDSHANQDGRRLNLPSSTASDNGSEYSEASEYNGRTAAGPGTTDALSTPTPEVPRETAPRTRRERGGRVPDNESGMGRVNGHFALPADDGMGVLRQKIHAIRDMQSTNTEKARMVHELMTEKYNASRVDSDGSNESVSAMLSPSSPRSPEQKASPMSPGDGQMFSELSSVLQASTTDQTQLNDNPYNLSTEALQPTFFPKAELDSPVFDEEDTDTEELEEAILGCQHYKRNVKLQCVTCKRWYTCRFCHDEVEDHHLIRNRTENMLCMVCGHAQPAAHFCANCEEQAAQYYCEVCKLWDNDSKKSIYHCSDCGICRIGQGLGKDFFHCKTCCVCLPISIENTHRCIERSTQCDCPICGDYMFTSPETVVVMRCGHSIHHRCLSEYSRNSYRCPICSKTIANMEATFRNLDRTIQFQPMPAEFKDTKALVYCNDCGAKSVVGYHWLGLKCDMCESYNTAQHRLLHGDILESPEQDLETRQIIASRTRSSSHGADEAMSQAMAPLRIHTNSIHEASHPQQSAPSSADPHGRFLSYSLTRDRAVSPVVSNYFGLPTNRESEKPKPASFFSGQPQGDAGEDHGGELRLWGTKLKYSYGFLSRETESADGESNAEDAVGSTEGSESEEGDEDEEEDEEGDDDDDDHEIDIFGHR